jgi:hypothetical protein
VPAVQAPTRAHIRTGNYKSTKGTKITKSTTLRQGGTRNGYKIRRFLTFVIILVLAASSIHEIDQHAYEMCGGRTPRATTGCHPVRTVTPR